MKCSDPFLDLAAPRSKAGHWGPFLHTGPFPDHPSLGSILDGAPVYLLGMYPHSAFTQDLEKEVYFSLFEPSQVAV